MKQAKNVLTVLFVLSSLCFGQSDTLTILFTSDTHSNLAPIGSRSDDLRGTIGGIARAATLIGTTKMTDPNVLTLHGGDIFIGDIFYNTYFGIAELNLMKAIGYDVMTLGNHEFDLGPKMLQMVLDSSMKDSPMSIVSSNIVIPEEEKLRLNNYINPYTIRQYGSLKVGIFGLTTPQTNLVSSPAPVFFDDKIYNRALNTVYELKQLGCTVIICLSHLGADTDVSLAKTVPDIDLIIGAHDHFDQVIKEYKNPTSRRTTWYSQTDPFYSEMGKIQLLVEENRILLLSAGHIQLDSKVPEEAAVKAEVDKLIVGVEQKFGPMFTKMVTYATDTFNETSVYEVGDGPKETAIGNFVTDAFRNYTQTDIAIEPGGSTAQPLYKGPIVGDDLFRAVGYGFNENNSLGFRLVTFTITGESLAVALEKCTATIEENDEFFPQVSGMEFSYTPTAPVGLRIREIKVNDLPLDPARRYSVTTNELALSLLTTMLEINVSDVKLLENMTEYQALERYVAKEESISPSIEGRINIAPMTQLVGTYTVGTNGAFSSLQSAFSSLGKNGVLSPVTLALTDELYDFSATGSIILDGPIPGASATNRITIRPAENKNVTIKGNSESTFRFKNVSYLTIDGISLQGNTRLKVQALYNSAFKYNEAIDFVGNCDFNIIQNLTASTDDIQRFSSGIGLYGDSTGAPDNCIISGVAVTSGMNGIYVSGGPLFKATGNIVRNNHIGSPSDSLIAWGIQDELTEGSLIENNHVENLRLTEPTNSIQIGINSYGSRNTIMRNNMVHNLCNTENNRRSIGMMASGSRHYRGSNVWIYNNKIWDMKNRGTETSSIFGIRAWYQDSLKADYNSVYLTESDDVPPEDGSYAIWFSSSIVYSTVRNNILVNTRDDAPYVSVAIRMDAASCFSDYNNLFVGPFSQAFIGDINTIHSKTLAAWQGKGKDLNSVNISPLFCTQTLHIDTTNTLMNALNEMGTPILGINDDFEGQRRDKLTPDIGADEFGEILTDVSDKLSNIPDRFGLDQNYPNPFNPSTTIRYALPNGVQVKLAVYDMLGREIATLVNEEQSAGWKEVQWNAYGIASGIYFYKLQAGNFVEIKRMVFLK